MSSNTDRAQLAALGAVGEALVPVMVPARFARRAELAAVLGELVEELLGPCRNPMRDTRPYMDRTKFASGSICWELVDDGECEAVWHTGPVPGRPGRLYDEVPWAAQVEDPLEAARLALAHVRGRG